MKTTLAIRLTAALLLATAVSAKATEKTDAQRDGLFGPIRSVSTIEETRQVELHFQESPLSVIPVLCRECEYDSDGNRIRSGQVLEGRFQGEIVRIVRDQNGKISEKIYENANGDVYRRDVLGPYGVMDSKGYAGGKLISHTTWSYDEKGRLFEFHSYDQDGVQVSSGYATNGSGEHNREQWDYGRENLFQLHFVETYDPKTDFWTFTNFNEDGSAKAAVTTIRSPVHSYRQAASETNVFGSSFFMDPEGKEQKAYRCHPDSSCDEITTFFVDEARHHVARQEWHDR